MGTGLPGAAVIDTLESSALNGRATIVTVQMAGSVAGDTDGSVQRSPVVATIDGVDTSPSW